MRPLTLPKQPPPRPAPTVRTRLPTARAAPRPTPAPASSPSTRDYFAADPRPVMLYDGDCRLCSTGVDVALALDGSKRLRFAALQSPAGRALLARSGRSPDDISSVVLVTPEGAAIKSEAVLAIASLLGVAPAALAALAAPLPRRARDGAYDAVADNRYTLFGRLGERRLTKGGGGEEEEDPGRWLVE